MKSGSSESGSTPHKSRSDGKARGIKICETELSTNNVRTEEKLPEVDTRNEKCI